ncbi:hypothetical protein SDC9_173209 [bioreactor metagenome]|uniref:Uncharacterized protein n=1 Tax=bioreactor metagenome TaxID=1076179 RepID=A0A645GPC2_9ZZZZ
MPAAVEHRAQILVSDIWALAVGLSRVMYLKEESGQFLIGDDLWVVEYAYSLQMAGCVRKHILVAWVFRLSPSVAAYCRVDTFLLLKKVFNTPETATGEHSLCYRRTGTEDQ